MPDPALIGPSASLPSNGLSSIGRLWVGTAGRGHHRGLITIRDLSCYIALLHLLFQRTGHQPDIRTILPTQNAPSQPIERNIDQEVWQSSGTLPDSTYHVSFRQTSLVGACVPIRLGNWHSISGVQACIQSNSEWILACLCCPALHHF